MKQKRNDGRTTKEEVKLNDLEQETNSKKQDNSLHSPKSCFFSFIIYSEFLVIFPKKSKKGGER